VDNLPAEPLIARWIRNNVPGWNEAVVVSKNPGGSKRVTSLADTLKLNFGIITTDRRRDTINGSTILERNTNPQSVPQSPNLSPSAGTSVEAPTESMNGNGDSSPPRRGSQMTSPRLNGILHPISTHYRQISGQVGSSPLIQSSRIDSESPPTSRARFPSSTITSNQVRESRAESDSAEEYTDERARDVITGRLIQGHIVDDDYPSPILSTMSGSVATLPGEAIGSPQFDDRDPMMSSFLSNMSADRLPGSTYDAATASDDEEGFKNPELEHTITLVGNVKDKTVIIMDDLIDQCVSWIAAAETVVKKGGAQKVYCVATHGLFGDGSLELMENCQCIDFIIVTNSYPIAPERVKASKKLVILDLAPLLAEAIRRNHYGESISQLYQYYQD
jgi:ribose-phosphate pyrophosphokinase